MRVRLHASSVPVALAAALVLAAKADAQTLAGSEWRPTQIGGVEVAAGAGLFVRFSGDRELQGSGGCNRFFGPYRLNGDGIAIGPLAATRMACPGPVMENEARFFQALESARRFSRQHIDLTLADDAGDALVLLVLTDAD